MTPEGKVKKKVTDMLKKYGIYYFSPLSGGFGKSGVPDIILCVKGRFVGVECKAGGGQVTALQQAQMDKIKKAGGYACVVRDDMDVKCLELLLVRLYGVMSTKRSAYDSSK